MMAKCIRCGKSFLGRIKIKLSDAEICSKCYAELGFDPKYAKYGTAYSWAEIKDGSDAYYARKHAKEQTHEAESIGLNLKLFRQLHAAGATDPEIRLMSAICATLSDEGRDIDVLDVALGDNGSLLVLVDDVVAIEYKSDSGVKWIRLPNESEEKIRISGPARINAMASRIVQAYDAATA